MPTAKKSKPAAPFMTPPRPVLEKVLLLAGGRAARPRASKPLDIGFRKAAGAPLALGWQDLPYAVRPGREPPLQILAEVYGEDRKRVKAAGPKTQRGKLKK